MMNLLLMFAVLVTSGDFDAHGKEENWEIMLADVVKMNGSLIKAYGCYCGVDGVGHGVPVDYIDTCCEILNCCYEPLKEYRCDPRTSYKYTYDGEDIECDMANRSSWCAMRVCKCDRYFTLCLRDSHGLYNPEFVPLWERHCSEAPPGCFDS